MLCRVCDGTALEPVIDLGVQPWCNHFLRKEEIGHEPRYPLRVVYCHSCATPQLDFTVTKEIMFGDHTYLSGVTKTLSHHFSEVASQVDQQFFQQTPHKSVLDIGSNDGTQLQHFQQLGYRVLGVESSKNTAKIANAAGVETLNEFFNTETAKAIGTQFHVINAAGVFFHLEELHSVTDGIRIALRDDGVFIVQFLYMKSIVENCAFDQIYHEHLLYYNLANIQVLLQRHGLTMFDARLAPIHGGSMVAYVCHDGQRAPTARLQALQQAEHEAGMNQLATYQQFARRIALMKQDNVRYLQAQKAAGKRIMGFGAPVKGNTLLNYFGVGTDLLDALVEKNTLRQGLYSPGQHIPIMMEDDMTTPPDVYYVLAWNFKREILKNNQRLIEQGVEFFFPVDPERDAA